MASGKDNWLDSGMDNGVAQGELMDDPDIFFSDQDKQKANGLTRLDLMKKTGKELAALVIENGKSALPQKTLEKKAKPFLCDLLLLSEKEAKKQNNGRIARSKSDTEHIVESVIEFFKEIMAIRNKKMKPFLEKIFRRAATPFIDEKVKNDELSIDKVNTFALVTSGVFIIADAIFGLSEIGNYIKDLVKKRREGKQHDSKS